MHVKIAGLGWFGEPLALSLTEAGYKVSGTTRTPEKKQILEAKGIRTQILVWPSLLEPSDCDVLVLNIPPFAEELEWFKSWKLSRKTWVIFISSTSVVPVPESASARYLEEQESWVKENFESWTILRFGGLLGNGRHPGKYLSGRKNLSGRLWPVNLIQLEDTIGAVMAVLSQGVTKEILHVVSDEHPTREEYYTNHCRKHDLPLPEFDQHDESIGKTVSNSDLKKYFVPKVPL